MGTQASAYRRLGACLAKPITTRTKLV